MKTGNLLFTMILFGLVLFEAFNYLSIDPTYGGVAGAFIIGILIGKIKGKNSGRYAFFSIFTYNLIAWILTFLFTSEGRISLQYGGIALYLIFGTLLMMFFFYSIIGFFVAFVASNLSRNKQDEGL